MKNWKHLTTTIGILVLSVLSLASCGDLSSEKTEKTPEVFTVRNNTGDTITYMYLKEPSTLLWGSDVLPTYSLSNGSSASVTVPNGKMDSQYKIDIQLKTSNGNFYTKLSQKLTHEGTVTFTSSDLDSSSPRTISLGNTTGNTITYMYLREPGTLLWGSDVLPTYSLSNGGSVSVTIPYDRMDSQYRTDIQLRTSNGNLYTRLSQTITHNGTVIFTSSDLDGSSPLTINIGNTTGDTITYMYLREPGTLLWGSDVLPTYSLSNGSSVSVTIPYDRMDSQYRTDIQLRTSNGNLYTRLSQTITHNGTVTFTSSDLDSTSPRTINLGNVTGDTITYMYLKEPGTINWGSDVLPTYSLSNGGSVSITVPYDRMDSQYRTDIQLRTSSGITYTKLSQTIIHRGTVTFSSSDKN